MDRSVLATGARGGLVLANLGLVVGLVYHALRVGGSPEPIMWIPSLGLLLNGLYYLAFAQETVALARNRPSQHRLERILSFGIEPSEQAFRWLGIAQTAAGAIMLPLWAFGLSD